MTAITKKTPATGAAPDALGELSGQEQPATAADAVAGAVRGVPAWGGAKTAVPADPLAAFASGGSATTIRYDMAEPTSYTGRHVLVLNYTLDDFASITADPVTRGQATRPAIQQAQGTVAPDDLTAGVIKAQIPKGLTGPVRPTPTVIQAGESPAGTPVVPVAASAAATADPHAALVVPDGMLVNPDTADDKPVILLHTYQLSRELSDLSWPVVKAAHASGKQIVVYRTPGGQWHYRVRPAPAPINIGDMNQKDPLAVRMMSSIPVTAAMMPRPEPDGGPEPPDPRPEPSLAVVITSPSRTAPPYPGPGEGLLLTVQGTCKGVAVYDKAVTVTVNDSSPATVKPDLHGNWAVQVSITESGHYVIKAHATASAISDAPLADDDQVTIDVTLGRPENPEPQLAPTVLITHPDQNSLVIAPTGTATVTVEGTVDTQTGPAVTEVEVSVPGSGTAASKPALQPTGDERTSTWKTTVLLPSPGRHVIMATARNAANLPAPAVSVTVTLLSAQPFRRLDRQLMLVETVGISSYLGNYGAGRLLKTISLLPGEETTISVQTYRKDEATAKNSSSILDSNSTEASADFEDTMSDEQSSKAEWQQSREFNVSAQASARWGWGSASVNATYNDKANSSRQDMTKTALTAVTKHANKASSNRNVTVNTEYSTATSSGLQDDTKRTLKNINVGRVLNFVFRQMTQEHVVVVHLIDAVIGDYTLDLLLNADGSPQVGPNGPVLRENYQEYSLPALGDFAAITFKDAAAGPKFVKRITEILSNIPNSRGVMTALVEDFIPTADNEQLPEEHYLRVQPNLYDTYETPGGATISNIPGIVLAGTTVVMRTDGVLVDALLGEGNALDSYSQGLQEVAIAERQAVVAERQAAIAERQAATARDKLALEIIEAKDADAAAVWERVFPAPTSVPATVVVPAHPNGSPAVAGG